MSLKRKNPRPSQRQKRLSHSEKEYVAFGREEAMIHARTDYNDRIQDKAGKIGLDEPVFLLRAKDAYAPDAVRAWAKAVESAGDKSLAAHVFAWADKMEQWQAENKLQHPDTPEELRVS